MGSMEEAHATLVGAASLLIWGPVACGARGPPMMTFEAFIPCVLQSELINIVEGLSLKKIWGESQDRLLGLSYTSGVNEHVPPHGWVHLRNDLPSRLK